MADVLELSDTLNTTVETVADLWPPLVSRLQNDLLCVEWDGKPYTLTHLPKVWKQDIVFIIVLSVQGRTS